MSTSQAALYKTWKEIPKSERARLVDTPWNELSDADRQQIVATDDTKSWDELTDDEKAEVEAQFSRSADAAHAETRPGKCGTCEQLRLEREREAKALAGA